jgi:menaquinone-dependent protoporphyrinogen IX oxidase
MTRNVLICYGTRYGTTTSVVQEMAKTIQESGMTVDVVDLKTNKIPHLVRDYDLVLVGSGIMAGQWTKHPLEFLNTHKEDLAEIRTAIFVVCGYANSPDKCDEAQTEYLDKVVQEYPELHIVSTGLFGGMFDFKRYNFVIRALVKRIVKQQLPKGEEVPEKIDFRNWDQIREWVTALL